MKRLFNILLLIFGISFVVIVISGIIDFTCIFKNLFGICCPGCGLTRSFIAILQLDFYSAFNYNILGIPLFIFGIVTCISLIIDIINNNNRTINFILRFFKKYYIHVISLVTITMIINNIRGI